jgi:hypothetical protein
MFTFLDKHFDNKSSRQLQNYQHKVGGLYGVLLIATGSYLATNFKIGVVIGFSSLCVSRLSSEISYRTQFKIQEEIRNKKQIPL